MNSPIYSIVCSMQYLLPSIVVFIDNVDDLQPRDNSLPHYTNISHFFISKQRRFLGASQGVPKKGIGFSLDRNIIFQSNFGIGLLSNFCLMLAQVFVLYMMRQPSLIIQLRTNISTPSRLPLDCIKIYLHCIC